MKRLTALLSISVLAASLTACGASKAPSAPAAPIKLTSKVQMKVTGTAYSADITWSVDGGIQQAADRQLPVTVQDFKADPPRPLEMPMGRYLQIMAQNKGDSGDVTCSIIVDGKVVSQKTSTGAYVIVSCDGRS